MAATRILPGGAIIDGVSMAANITSDTLDVQGAGVVGLQFVAATGTHVGTFAVELSVNGSTWDATNFRISAGTSATSVAAANGVALAELVTVDVGQARHLRVAYTFSSGTGTAYVYAVRKRLAASAQAELSGVKTNTDTLVADIDDIQSGTFFDCSTAGGSRTFTDTSAKTEALPAGLYAVSSDQTCHIKTGPAASITVAVGGGTRIPADTVIGIVIDATNTAIAAIREGVNGTLYYSKVKAG